MIRSLYVKSQSIISTSNITFWWELQTQTEWLIFEAARTHHLGLKTHNFENPMFTFECFSLKAVYNFCKLQRLLQVFRFLFMYSFTHTNIVFLFRKLFSEIAIFINVCYQMKCFSGNSFSFLGIGFANISPDIFDFMWSSNKEFKDIKIFWKVHLRPFIRYQGKYLDLFWIWCYFFFWHCLPQSNQVFHIPLYIIFIITIKLWIFQTVNLYLTCFWNIAL